MCRGEHRFAHETVFDDQAQRGHFTGREIARVWNAIQCVLARLRKAIRALLRGVRFIFALIGIGDCKSTRWRPYNNVAATHCLLP